MKRKISCILIGLILGNMLTFSKVANADAGSSGYTEQSKSFTTGESTSSTITKQFTVPYVKNIKSITTNTGQVASYRVVNSNTIEVTLKNGSSTRSSTPSTYVTKTQTSSSNSFANSIYVSQDGISGYINKSGGSWSEVTSGSEAGSFWHEREYDYTEYTFGRYNGGDPSVTNTGNWTYNYPSVGYTYGAPGYLEYKTVNGRTVIYGPATNCNWDSSRDYTFTAPDGTVYRTTSNQKIYTDLGGSNGYYGVLKQMSYYDTSSKTPLLNWGSNLRVGDIYNYQKCNIRVKFGANVSKPDTRVWQYKQNYAGTIYGSTTYYYDYSINVKYEADPNASITASVANNGFAGTTVNWNITDASGQSYYYDLYRNGSKIASNLTSTSYIDYGAKDNSNPTVSSSINSRQGTKYTLGFSNTDTGSTYTYYVIAKGRTYGSQETSNSVSTTMTYGLKEYLYKVSTSSTATINGVNLVSPEDGLVHVNHGWNLFNYSGSTSSFAIGTNGYNGLNYGRIIGSGMGDTGVMMNIPVQKNTNYTTSAMIRLPSGSTNAGNGSLFIVNNLNNAGIVNTSANGSSTSWQKVETTFNSGNNDSIYIRINRGNASELQFTDVRVEKSDDYDTTTSSSITTTLNANTTYYLYTKARDKNNNLSSVSKTTISVPNIAVNLTAGNGSSNIPINWTNNDSTQTYLYDLYRNGTKIASNLSTTSYTDSSITDTNAPSLTTSNVNASREGTKINVNVNATDIGTNYNYYVIAKGQSDSKSITSNTDTGTLTSGIKGYSYLVTTNSTVETNNSVTSNQNSYSQIVNEGTSQYVNVKAIDNDNNISNNVKVPISIPTLNINLTSTLDSLTQITLNWAINDSTQQYKYDIYRDGTKIASDVVGTTYVDKTVLDKAIPDLTTSNISYTRQGSKIIVTINPPNDNGTTYSYYIVAKGQSDGKTKNSNSVSNTITSGIKGYSYLFTDSNSLTTDNTVSTTSNSFSQVLQDNKTFYLNVKSIDVQGNASSNVKLTIVIPDIVITLNNTVNNMNQVTLNWTNSDSTQSYRYDLYRNGVKIASDLTTTTFVDKGVQDSINPDNFNINYYREGTKYTFKITSLSIDKGSDYTYYVIAKGQSDLLNYTSNNSLATVISGIDNYKYSLTKTGDTQNTLVFPSSNEYSINLEQGKQYTFKIEVYDKAGNKGVNGYNIVFSVPVLTSNLSLTEVSNGIKLDYNTYANGTIDTTQSYKYDIYRNNKIIASEITANSYIDTGGVDSTSPQEVANIQIFQDMSKLLDYEKVNIGYNNSNDIGTNYTYYVVAKGQKDGTKTTSNSPNLTITSGLKGYYYLIDSSPNTIVNSSNGTYTSLNSIKLDKLTDGQFYLHIASIDNKNNISVTMHRSFIVVNLMKFNSLKLTNHVNKPTSLNLPVNFPNQNTPIKTGFNLTFEVSTDSIDNVVVEFYNNNKLVSINKNNYNYTLTTNNRNTKTSIMTLYIDNLVPQNEVISMKIKGIKNRADGTTKELIDVNFGENALKVIGTSYKDVYTNYTN